MTRNKAYRKRHTPSKRTYVSLTMPEKERLETIRGQFRAALGHDLSASLVISTALSVLAIELEKGSSIAPHPDAYRRRHKAGA